MSNEHADPFDTTIWDPINPEYAIEDPFHGPEARLQLLSIPPFRNEDGTYHVFGALGICVTTTFDAEGRPFVRIAAASSMLGTLRDITLHQDWINKHARGELPAYDELDYPVFRLDVRPYIVL